MSHSTSNTAATISNAEVSTLKQQAPGLEVNNISQPVQPAEPIQVQPVEPQPAAPENDVSLPDPAPVSQQEDSVKVNGHSSEPLESIKPTQDDTLVSNPISEPQLENTNTMDITPPTIQIPSDPIQIAEQAPVSDLRTASHSDALSPEAVADVEAVKHEMDNNADIQTSSAAPAEPIEVIPTVQETGLRTPQSPPAEPVSVAATVESVVEPQNDNVVPSVEVVDSTIPGEKPADPTPTPAVPVAESQDHEMTDAPIQSAKHDRDEDATEEPLAKRVKTETVAETAQQNDFKVPESPAPAVTPAANTSDSEPTDANDIITPLRHSHIKKVISNLKKSNSSLHFRTPVDYVALNIPTYPQIITRPMDLGKIDAKLKTSDLNAAYKSVHQFTDDFHQIVTNCVTFNGPEHSVTLLARKMEASFNSQMKALPPATEPEQKPKPKVIKQEPIRAPQPRRSSVNNKASSPTTAPGPTFALNPDGVPLIRRDSAIDENGRPKRAVVPSRRNRESLGGSRPRKKKFEMEMKFCDEVLKNISSAKHWQANQYFTHPVDPVALNIPTYFQIIKKPMDLGTVRTKLDAGMYERAKDFEEDVRQIFKNCYKFNPEGDYVYQRGQDLERLFDQELAKKNAWIKENEPPSAPDSDEDDDEESEDEAEAESDEDDAGDKLTVLQKQLMEIQAKMSELEKSKKKASPGAPKKKDKKKDKKSTPSTKFPGLHPQKEKTKKKDKKFKPERERYVTFAEKQYISNGIAMLPERPMAEALKIIQSSVPALANSDQGEIELDIEEVPNYALLKLLKFVKQYAGPPPEEAKEEQYIPSTAPVKSSKKGKSMSKHEHEQQIAELKGTLRDYDTASPDAIQSAETGAEDSDDDSDQESEEE